MSLDAFLKEMGRFVAEGAVMVANLKPAPTRRNHVSLAALHLAMEHHESIMLLAENKQYGSAAALLRLQAEAFVRGAWLHQCADEESIVKFENDTKPPEQSVMIQDLEKDAAYSSKQLSQLHTKFWKALNSYTHGGGLHVSRRMGYLEVGPQYTNQEMREMLEHSNLYGLFTLKEFLSYETEETDLNAFVSRFPLLFKG
jgi:hypothetical protein